MTIKIRFIERCSEHFAVNDYIAQKKTLFGWKYIGYWQSGGAGDSVWYLYSNKDKKSLLTDIIEKYYKSNFKSVSVKEYPSIKYY